METIWRHIYSVSVKTKDKLSIQDFEIPKHNESFILTSTTIAHSPVQIIILLFATRSLKTIYLTYDNVLTLFHTFYVKKVSNFDKFKKYE